MQLKEKWDDKVILDKIRAGKQSGLTEFFAECGGRLVKFFKWKFKLSHEDAEEALQETLIRFIQSVCHDKFHGDASIYTYLSKIGVNECLRVLQKNIAYTDILIDGMAIEEVIDHSKDLEKELHYRLCVAKALDEFEKAEQNANERLTALTLQYKGGSIKEIAEEIGRNEGATKTFLSECRKKLRVYLLKCRDECN